MTKKLKNLKKKSIMATNPAADHPSGPKRDFIDPIPNQASLNLNKEAIPNTEGDETNPQEEADSEHLARTRASSEAGVSPRETNH